MEGETTFRVRAGDNGVYLVPSVYDGNSMVIDPLGRVLATSDGHKGLFWCEFDLSRLEPSPGSATRVGRPPRPDVPATGACLRTRRSLRPPSNNGGNCPDGNPSARRNASSKSSGCRPPTRRRSTTSDFACVTAHTSRGVQP